MTTEMLAALLGRIIDARTDLDLAMVEAQLAQRDRPKDVLRALYF